MHDVVNIVSQRLQEISRFQAAAELHEGIDDVQVLQLLLRALGKEHRHAGTRWFARGLHYVCCMHYPHSLAPPFPCPFITLPTLSLDLAHPLCAHPCAWQGAIRAYCCGHLFDNARQLAGNNPTFNTYIEDQYNQFLLQNKAADELATRGGNMAIQGIDMYMQRDEWDRVHALAAQQGPEVAAQYALKHAERRFKQGEYGEVGGVGWGRALELGWGLGDVNGGWGYFALHLATLRNVRLLTNVEYWIPSLTRPPVSLPTTASARIQSTLTCIAPSPWGCCPLRRMSAQQMGSARSRT